MTPEQISQAIRAAGLKKTQVAKACGCSPSHLYRIIRGVQWNSEIADYICDVIGRPGDEVFNLDQHGKRTRTSAGYRIVVRVARGGVIESTYLDERLFRTQKNAIRAAYRLNRIDRDGAGNIVERKSDVLPWLGPPTINHKRFL